MDDYISREAAIESLEFCAELCRAAIDSLVCDPKNQEIRLDQIEDDIDTIKNEPAADVRENVRGEWILDEYPHDGDCRCSACFMAIDQMHERNHKLLNAITGGKWWTFYKFCPNCGATMENK